MDRTTIADGAAEIRDLARILMASVHYLDAANLNRLGRVVSLAQTIEASCRSRDDTTEGHATVAAQAVRAAVAKAARPQGAG